MGLGRRTFPRDPDQGIKQGPRLPARVGKVRLMLTVVTSDEPTPAATTTGGSLIDEIVRDGARRMLAAALEGEGAGDIAAHTDQLDADGRRLVVRNGHATPRQVLTSSGAVEVLAPRIN